MENLYSSGHSTFRKVLVLEDSDNDFVLLCHFLKRLGYQNSDIMCAESMDSLTKAAEQHGKPELLFCDLSLPDSSGLDTYIKSQELYPDTPVIVLSGTDDNRLALDCVKNGAKDYLVKGDFNLAALEKSIHFAREHQQLRNQVVRMKNDYKAIFDKSPLIKFVFRADNGHFLNVNETALCKYGYSREEFLLRRIYDLVPASRRQGLQESIDQTITDKPFQREVTHLKKSGDIFQVKVIAHRTEFEGQPAIIVVGEDVTENRETEVLLNNAQRMSRIGAWKYHVANDEFRLSEISKEILQITEDQEVALDGFIAVQDSEEGLIIQKLIKEAISDGKTLDHELLLNTFGGEKRWVRCMADCVYMDKEIVALEGSIQDIHRQKLSELRLAESERTLSHILNNIPGYIIKYRLNADGSDRFLFAGGRFEEIWGVTKEQAFENPSNVWVHVHQDDVSEMTRSIEESARNLTAWEAEFRIKQEDGSYHWVHAIGTPQRTADGGCEWDTMAIDISKRKAYQRKLEGTLLDLEESHEIAQMGGWKYYVEHDSFSVSQSVLKLLAWPEHDKLTFDKFLAHIDERDIAKVQQMYPSMAVGGEQTTVEFRFKKNGEQRWFFLSSNPDYKNGSYVSSHGILQDITESKRKEEALKASNDRFTYASKATSEAIYDWNLEEGKVIRAEAYTRLFGYSSSESSDEFVKHIVVTDRQRVNNVLETAMKDPKCEKCSAQYRFVAADGNTRYVDDRAYIIRNEKGQAVRLIGSFSDVTDRVTFNERLLEATIRSQEDERNRIAKELHDGIVQQMVACSMKTQGLAKYHDQKALLEDGLQDLTNLVRKVTEETRCISHNLLSADFSNMTLVELLERFVYQINHSGDIGFEFLNFVPEGYELPEDIKVNLYRCVQELVTNIVKHSNANRAIISLEEVDRRLFVTVIDNGEGMASDLSKNDGIGLSNVRNRVLSIGGSLEFRNLDKTGLETSIEVPLPCIADRVSEIQQLTELSA